MGNDRWDLYVIDFRYHLVSLASVLIALAVGIVLGAGPLNSGILESVNNEVKTLRADKADLRTQLDAVTNSVDLHRSFEAARLPDLVAGKLEGRQVVVVALPGAPAGLLSTTEDTIAAAGATITGRITIGDAATDATPTAVAARDAAAAQATTDLAVPAGAVAGSALSSAIAAILLDKEATTPPDAEAFVPTPQARAAAWTTLSDAKLVSGTMPATVASLAVVVSGPPAALSDAASSAASAYAALTAALDARGNGAILAASLNSTDKETVSAVAISRSDAAMRRTVSTVDNAATTIGQASIVYALSEQVQGKTGQYGTYAGATRAFPIGG